MTSKMVKSVDCFYCDNQSYLKDKTEGIRVSPLVKEKPLVIAYDDAQCVYELFQNSVARQPKDHFLGWHDSPTAPYKWMNYEEVNQNVELCGSGLLTFDEVKSASSSCIGIYSSNRPEWLTTELACFAYGLVVVPLYDTLGSDAMKHICNEAELSVVVCDKPDRALKLINAHEDLPYLKHIVIFSSDEEEVERLRDQAGGEISVLTFDKLLHRGSSNRSAPSPLGRDGIILICYTSGTLGTPKGAIIRNSNVLGVIGGTKVALEKLIDKDDTFFSFLPLAHIYEQFCEIYITWVGARIGFYSGNILNVVDDMATLRPTIFTTVPRLMYRLYDLTHETVRNSRIKKYILNWAVKKKCEKVDKQIYKFNCLCDTIVFDKIRRKFGAQIRVVLIAGAPISPTVLRFTRAVFSCPVLEGYGATETCGPLSMSVGGDLMGGHVGAPLPMVELKLVDVPEMGLVASRDNKGEICARGSTCISGYYKNAEKTAELIDEAGWLHTGDIGTWVDGSLKVIDRCKHIFKLAQGEYVAPEKLEQVYISCEYAAQIFVDGDSMYSFPVALVVPVLEALLASLNKSKPDGDKSGVKQYTIEEICELPEAKDIIMAQFKILGENAHLMGFEKVRNIKLIPEPFTIENLLLTPTLKTTRPAVRKRYEAELSSLYKEGAIAQ